MRIICQKCAAAYAIDDRVITPKGVRAQCPRCRHLQLVKREDSPAAKPAPGARPATAPKPAVAASPAPSTARPATPSASLSDELFGDLGDLEPAPEPNDAPPGSLLNDLAELGRPSTPASPVLDKDSLFGDLSELTQSSPSNPEMDLGAASKPSASSYSIPSGDLLFDEIAPPPAPVPRPMSAAAALPEMADDGIFDFNAPPGFDAPPPVAAPAPQPKPAAAVLPEMADDGIFDFNAPPGFSSPPPVAAPAAAADPEGDPLLDFFGEPPPQPMAVAAPMPVAAPAPASAPAPTGIPKTCRECGKQLVDPFDQALGACEGCRHRGQQKPTPAPVPETRSVEVIDLPPLGETGAPGAAFLPPEPGSSARPAPAAPVLAPEPRSVVMQRSGVAVSASSGGGRGALVAAAVVLLLVGGGGAAYFFVPQVRELVGGQSGGGGGSASPSHQRPADAALPPAVESVLPRWQLMFVDAQGGDSKQLLAQGQSLLEKDQRLAYSEAAESFQRALLLDPRSDTAIGGYVQALALGLGSRMDDAAFAEARSLIEAAEGRSSRVPEVLVAHANLLLARSGNSENVQQAQKLAEEVLANSKVGTPAQKAEAHLVLGRVFLASSRELANQNFESALAIAPDFQRVHYYRALADETAGDYSLAIERLRKRLAGDPDHWETRSTLARIFMEVGQVEQARELYTSRLKSTPADFQALLAMAVMRYQVENGLSGGLGALRALLRHRDKYDEREVAELLVHLAAAERSANNLEAAAKAARESLQLMKENPAAHLQLFLVSVKRKGATAAAEHLASLQGQLDSPALEKMLEGRLRLLERKPAEAMTLFLEASRLDARYGDALLLAGVAAAQDGRRDEAFRVLSQATQGDPLRLTPRPVVTPFFLRPEDLLEGLEGSIVGAARGADDILANLYEGFLRFHQGEAAAAEKLLKKVNDIDTTHALASSYRALIAMGRKDMKSAKAHAARAVVGGRQVAIAHLVQGLVLVEAKELDPAKRSLREAVTLAPKLYSAEVKLAELEGASSSDSVRERLVRLLGLDPSYLPARRVLYSLDKRG